MRKTVKWIIMLAAAVLLAGLTGSAMADDRVYTSPAFRIPGSRIEMPAEEPTEETETEAEIPVTDTVPSEDVSTEAKALESPEEKEPVSNPETMAEEAEIPDAEPDEPEETPEGPDEPAGDPEEPAEEYDELENDADEWNALAAGTDPWDAPTEEETEPEERQVLIRSSRRENVTGGETIELTSRLIGFGDAEVHYQWQVDRNDGAGWVNAEDGNRWKYTFLADRTTVMYNWRLIVTVDE